MLVQNPYVADHGFRLSWYGRDDLLVGVIGSLQNDVDLAACKARQRQVEIDVERTNFLQLEPEDFDGWLDGSLGVEILKPAAEEKLR